MALSVLLLCALLTNTARADVERWLPDFGEWIEKGLKPFFNLIYENIAWIGGFIERAIKRAVDGIVEFFQKIWSKVSEFFVGIVKVINDAWDWVKEGLEEWYEWLTEQAIEWSEWLWECVLSIMEWCLDWIEYYGEVLTNFLYSVIDWFVTLAMDFILWSLSELPKVDMPSGFNRGMDLFIGYGMIFNDIFPFTETLAWFVLYITIFVGVTIYRIIKSFIPVVAT